MSDIWWSLPLTLLVFFGARRLAAKVKISLLNPLLISMAVIIPLLLLMQMPYARYFQGSAILNQLLQPAVVALALPLYEQMHQIRARWKSIIGVCFIGSMTAMISGTAIALWMGATPQIAATIMPKSVTTPIAMAVSATLGGIPAISAICVLIAGVLGAVFGHMLLNLLKIRSKASRGLAIGNASHALGTARCSELDYQEGAYSSLALVICGIITSLLAPLLYPLMMHLWR
ncbi:CidB/LrgB family autolysis modulator [Erwinia phyllosphaerae]|uniref:CidB/LrgB family autolysis modulator n=1 Tax=Erwinia phyllosphaerae TaxID=2853256 RepID=UPI001FEE5E40|nr:CidB/LrgB family autolysis modulator [Erwinia phyllosphaerae]MBV4365444.1 CidB/LrgB family autolysis modulator [Erwinia phyllosphaerae]